MRESHRRRFCGAAARSALALVLLHAACAIGAIRPIGPGQEAAPAADEGLLAVAVDTPVPLDGLRFARVDVPGEIGTLRRVGVGHTRQLYIVPAGRYRWEWVRVDDQTHTLADEAALAFDVKAGRINYPGDLIVRPHGWVRVAFDVSNRGLPAMDWLDAEHPALAQRFEFAYAGHDPDPFPAFYRSAARAHPHAGDRTLPPPASGGPLPLPIADLWRPSRFVDVRINAGGDLMAQIVREPGAWSLDLFDLRAGTSQRLLSSPEPIADMAWTSDRGLVLSVGDGVSNEVSVVRIADRADGTRRYDRLRVPRRGHVVDVLPQPDRILFASRSHTRLLVHVLDVSTQASIDAQRFRVADARNRGVANDEVWFVDGNGALRAALARDAAGPTLYHGRDGDFHAVLRMADVPGFQPHGLSADGNTLYGITDAGREQAELVAFDLAAGRIVQTLFSRPGSDIVAPLFDPSRKLIGASYFEDGQLVSTFFDADEERIQRRLRAAFPDRTVWVLDRDGAHRNLILGVSGSDQPGRLYHLDLEAGEASLLDDSRPWLAQYRFAPTHVLRSTSRDGLAIESYLTVPRGVDGRLPLVVFPHGGPIGVRDARVFDPEVQFLASLGYAVLQVNFRGSAGFGRAFRAAGKRSYGSLIEDDIDAAIETALAQHPLDGGRMCTIGASYGGYSALVSAVRWPERFRCAISIAGISDTLLFFTASDTGRNVQGRALLETAIGNPATDGETMQRYSPLYRYAELTVPVMLVHGTEDRRVDYEHTRRLARMLALAGHPPVLLTLDGAGHGALDAAARERLWSAIAGFLRMHLARRAPAH
ncbi:S9 family peptidase [Chiayiivirga flava]|uniref:Dipeptidyl aminopeptidase/acylaminoacyl peptidase n=1 Tax=Chiayiivirga flava TaxID=659595 RepID=A0A7W8D4I7_9GAMM|nr:prolyl oligopeptidase family serine peptidase [Chiayiivirga flava]MBB5207387.1 dipeptidyl aminopeptidase/acylaminoacyl peptidase [Chiayiivirga flava]